MNDRKWQPRKILFIGTYAGKQYFEQLVFEKKYIQLAANQTEKYYIEELSNLKLPLCVLSGLVTNGAPVKTFLSDMQFSNFLTSDELHH